MSRTARYVDIVDPAEIVADGHPVTIHTSWDTSAEPIPAGWRPATESEFAEHTAYFAAKEDHFAAWGDETEATRAGVEALAAYRAALAADDEEAGPVTVVIDRWATRRVYDSYEVPWSVELQQLLHAHEAGRPGSRSALQSYIDANMRAVVGSGDDAEGESDIDFVVDEWPPELNPVLGKGGQK